MVKTIIVLGLFLVGCQTFNDRMGLKDDNEIEEISEEVIKAKTGMDIDFSPRSPEKGKA